MAKARKVAKSLADEIVEEPFVRSGPKGWFTYLAEDIQADLLEVRRRLQARDGKYELASAQEVAKRLKKKLNLQVSDVVIRRWLGER